MKKKLRELLAISLTIPLINCASLPPPPEGELCIMQTATSNAACVPITKKIQSMMNKEPMPLDDSHLVNFSEMNKWVAFSPETWANIEAYILKIKTMIENILLGKNLNAN